MQVSENGHAYRPGGCTELGCTDAPGTFGSASLGNSTRIVWHYQAADELRTFVVHYRLRGVAVAYDDVVDVNLQVWGSEWTEALGRLTATEAAPGKILRAWGHPVYVRGDVQLAGKRVVLRALNVPAGQFVELRTLIPRAAFTSTLGMRIAPGNGLAAIVAEEAADAAEFEQDSERIDHAKQHPWRYALYLFLLGTIPAFLVVGAVFWFHGRELETGYDREYEQEPPTDDGAGARPDAAAAGWRGRLVRVHRDAVRPDPPWRLLRQAGHDRPGDLGRAAHGERLGPRALRRKGGRAADGAGRRAVAHVVDGVIDEAPSACRASASGSRPTAQR